MTKLANGQLCSVEIDGKTIYCRVAGIASELPVVGYLYILKLFYGGELNEIYPYECFVMPESLISVL